MTHAELETRDALRKVYVEPTNACKSVALNDRPAAGRR
jgi:hypothetical protein